MSEFMIISMCEHMSSAITIRSFDWNRDHEASEELERRCASSFLIADSMGDPLCRIRNSPIHEMLVAELGNELVGIIRGSIKIVKVGSLVPIGQAKVGYILGLRVSPLCRRRGLGMRLVSKMEEWFVANLVDYAYMATNSDNEASVKLFTEKLGYNKFRRPVILVNPVSRRPMHISSSVDIKKLDTSQADQLYRRFMSPIEFFPQDIGCILDNKLSLGTWLACPQNEMQAHDVDRDQIASSWAMLSVWNCGEVFKLRVRGPPILCVLLAKASRIIDQILPCLRIPAIPSVFSAFGFYFMYGVHGEGPEAAALVRSLCHYVHNFAMKSKDCKVVVTEVGSCDANRHHIPHWEFLSCSQDLWCIKSLKKMEEDAFTDWIKAPPPAELFVDPREI